MREAIRRPPLSEGFDGFEELPVLAPEPELLLHVLPAQHTASIDQEIGALRESEVLDQHAVAAGRLAEEVRQELGPKPMVVPERPEARHRVDRDAEDPGPRLL